MSNQQPGRLFGQCLCGRVQYAVDKLEPKMGNCHCSMCRKFHGAAFATFGEVRSEYFHWLQGEREIKQYLAPNGTVRQFCNNCGSSLTFAASADEVEVVEFTLGTLDSDIDQRPDVHIFTAYKANWVIISDDLPQFKDGRDS